MNKIAEKIQGVVVRTRHAIVMLPARVGRLTNHLFLGISGQRSETTAPLPVNRYRKWWLELLFMTLDLFAVPEIYETVIDILKWNTRALTSEEIALARSVYGASIDYRRVRVDEKAYIACRHHHVYYVSFFTINGWGNLRKELFIHEMMHVWQFQHLGAIYIPLALMAQRTELGYNYGGGEALEAARSHDTGFSSFNLEQQADIVADYYCLREGLVPRWIDPTGADPLPVFEYFIRKLASG